MSTYICNDVKSKYNNKLYASYQKFGNNVLSYLLQIILGNTVFMLRNLVCPGCQQRIPLRGTYHKLVSFQFWKLEDQDQGASRFVCCCHLSLPVLGDLLVVFLYSLTAGCTHREKELWFSFSFFHNTLLI